MRSSPKPWIPDTATYDKMYAASLCDPDAFWSKVAQDFEWEHNNEPRASPKAHMTPPGVHVSWFAGERTNVCYNALDRWVATGAGDRPCFLCEGNDPIVKRMLTYSDVLDRVQRSACALLTAGVRKGDRVVLYLPMIPDLPIAMLALARIGAVHAVVFAGFSAEALASRIVAADARVVITCEYATRAFKSIPLKNIADEALSIAAARGHEVRTLFVVPSPEPVTSDLPPVTMAPRRDTAWEEALAAAPVTCPITWVNAEDPLFVLYTSGSTGEPKVLVSPNSHVNPFACYLHNY